MSYCQITILPDGQRPLIEHSHHIGFEEWFTNEIPVRGYKFEGKSKKDADVPVFSFLPKYIELVTGLAKAAFGDKLEIIEAGEIGEMNRKVKVGNEAVELVPEPGVIVGKNGQLSFF